MAGGYAIRSGFKFAGLEKKGIKKQIDSGDRVESLTDCNVFVGERNCSRKVRSIRRLA